MCMCILVCVCMCILVCVCMYIGMCVCVCVTDQSSFHGTQFVFHSRTKSAIAVQELAKAAILLVLDFYA